MSRKAWMAKTKKVDLGLGSELGARLQLGLFFIQSKLLLELKETQIKQKYKAKF